MIAIRIPVADAFDRNIRHVAIHLVRRRIDHDRRRRTATRRVEHIERPQGVGFEVVTGIAYRQRDRHLRGHVEYNVGSADLILQDRAIGSNVSANDPKTRRVPVFPQPLNVQVGPLPRKVVEDSDRLPGLQRARSGINADEAGAANNKGLLVHLLINWLVG
jgi:hypothetical protein